MEMKENSVSCLADMKKIDWNSVKPVNNLTITRMLIVSTGVFTALDVGEAIATKKYWVSIIMLAWEDLRLLLVLM